jgi:hypothetical protein
LKRGSMKFWLFVSLVLAATATGASGERLASGAAQDAARRNNETLLAGLRPGRDALLVAEKRFKTKSISEEPNS